MAHADHLCNHECANQLNCVLFSQSHSLVFTLFFIVTRVSVIHIEVEGRRWWGRQPASYPALRLPLPLHLRVLPASALAESFLLLRYCAASRLPHKDVGMPDGWHRLQHRRVHKPQRLGSRGHLQAGQAKGEQ